MNEMEKMNELIIKSDKLQAEQKQLDFKDNTILYGLINKVIKPLQDRMTTARANILIEMDKLGTKQWKNDIAQFSVCEKKEKQYLNDVPSKINEIEQKIIAIEEEKVEMTASLDAEISKLNSQIKEIKIQAEKDGEVKEVPTTRFIKCTLNK